VADVIRDIMSTQAVAVTADTSITETARVMRDQGIGDVLVVDGDAVLGIVTDRDITVRATAEGLDPDTTPVDLCHSGDLQVVDADASAGDVARLFRDRAIRRAPVVENGMVVGMVSLGDLARERDPASALAEISSAPPDR
jgi:CBS domain-containing protein